MFIIRIVMNFAYRLITFAYRRTELLADHYAAKVMGELKLINALFKIGKRAEVVRILKSDVEYLNTKYNELNDRFVETYQGKRARITFSSEFVANVSNYISPETDEFHRRLQKQKDSINAISKEVEKEIDLMSILEDMLEAVNQLKYHLTLK